MGRVLRYRDEITPCGTQLQALPSATYIEFGRDRRALTAATPLSNATWHVTSQYDNSQISNRGLFHHLKLRSPGEPTSQRISHKHAKLVTNNSSQRIPGVEHGKSSNLRPAANNIQRLSEESGRISGYRIPSPCLQFSLEASSSFKLLADHAMQLVSQ